MPNDYAARAVLLVRAAGFVVLLFLMKSLEAVKAMDLLKLVTQYLMMVICQHYCVRIWPTAKVVRIQ